MKTERANQMSESRGSRYLEDNLSRRESNIDGQGQSVDEYSLTLKKAEIVAAAKIACAYLGEQKEITFDSDISDAEILKYQDELTNF
jgi:hypothetical protein